MNWEPLWALGLAGASRTVRRLPDRPRYACAAAIGRGVSRLFPDKRAAVERNLSRYFSGFPDGLPPPGLYHRVLREVEYPLLTAALAATRGNQIRAADLLGVNRNTLRKKIRDLDIQVIRTTT